MHVRGLNKIPVCFPLPIKTICKYEHEPEFNDHIPEVDQHAFFGEFWCSKLMLRVPVPP